MKVRKAIIPVAGFGTRFLPITKAVPKTLLPIIDKPSIHYLVEEAVASGIDEIYIITGQDKEIIEKYFKRSKELEAHLRKTGRQDLLEAIIKTSQMAEITCVNQEHPLGLGHAIYCARDLIKTDTFAVLLGDDLVNSQEPCLLQLIKVAQKYKTNIIGVQPVPDNDISNYGIIKGQFITNKLLKLEDLVEKPNRVDAPSNLAILGRYIINPQIFPILNSIKPGKGGEIQLTDGLKELNKQQEIYAYIFEGVRYDVGDKMGFLKATIDFALQRQELKEDLQKYLNTLS